MKPKFTIKKAKNDHLYFTLMSKSGQPLVQSELYNSKDACENGIISVKLNASIAEIDDQTEVV